MASMDSMAVGSFPWMWTRQTLVSSEALSRVSTGSVTTSAGAPPPEPSAGASKSSPSCANAGGANRTIHESTCLIACSITRCGVRRHYQDRGGQILTSDERVVVTFDALHG